MSSEQAENLATIDSQAAISFLIATGGNAPLAAVKASKALGGTITEAQILVAISSDPTAITYLGNQIKVLAMIQTLDAFRLTHMTYLEKLPKMAPADVARTYTKLLQTISQGMEAPQTNDSGMERLIRSLPPQVAGAVKFFMDNPGAAEELPSITSDESSPGNLDTDYFGEAEEAGVTLADRRQEVAA